MTDESSERKISGYVWSCKKKKVGGVAGVKHRDSNQRPQGECMRAHALLTHPPHLQLLVEGLFGVHAKALAWARAASTPGALLRRGLGDGRHEQRLDTDAWVVHLLLAKAGVHNKPGGVGGGVKKEPVLQQWLARECS